VWSDYSVLATNQSEPESLRVVAAANGAVRIPALVANGPLFNRNLIFAVIDRLVKLCIESGFVGCDTCDDLQFRGAHIVAVHFFHSDIRLCAAAVGLEVGYVAREECHGK
jgi:hypothetical protein